LLRLTRGEPAHQSRSPRIESVGDNQATSIDGITLSDRKVEENARTAADMTGKLDRQSACRCRAGTGDLRGGGDLPTRVMPTRGRCASVYLCTRLHAANGDSNRQFALVVRRGERTEVAESVQVASGDSRPGLTAISTSCGRAGGSQTWAQVASQMPPGLRAS